MSSEYRKQYNELNREKLRIMNKENQRNKQHLKDVEDYKNLLIENDSKLYKLKSSVEELQESYLKYNEKLNELVVLITFCLWFRNWGKLLLNAEDEEAQKNFIEYGEKFKLMKPLPSKQSERFYLDV